MDKIVIVDSEGKQKDVNFLTILTLKERGNFYLVYTEQELTEGENSVFFARITEEDGHMCLGNIESKEELMELQQAFREEYK